MKFGRKSRWFLRTILAVFVAGAALYAWSYWPLSADAELPDPAVTVANEISTNGAIYSEGYVESRGHQIHYVTAGEGDPIIFLHGFPSYWFTMFGLMDTFGADYQVIAIDGLGVGHSDAPTSIEEYRLQGLVADVEAVADHLQLEEFHLVGHDWGAAIATAMVQDQPERVKTLTAIGALPHNILLERLSVDPEHSEIFSYVSTFSSANPVLIKLLGAGDDIWSNIYAPLYDRGLMPQKQAERLQADLGDARRLDRFINWYRANIPEFDSITDDDFWPARGARISVPALFIYGSEDQVVTEALVDDLRASADSMEVLRFDGVEHRPHFEQKQALAEAIRELIERESASASEL